MLVIYQILFANYLQLAYFRVFVLKVASLRGADFASDLPNLRCNVLPLGRRIHIPFKNETSVAGPIQQVYQEVSFDFCLIGIGQEIPFS